MKVLKWKEKYNNHVKKRQNILRAPTKVFKDFMSVYTFCLHLVKRLGGNGVGGGFAWNL